MRQFWSLAIEMPENRHSVYEELSQEHLRKVVIFVGVKNDFFLWIFS